MVGVVDYGMGNLLSVQHALAYLGADVQVCGTPESLSSMDRLVLPGVGAFRDCIQTLRDRGFATALTELVQIQKKPILGICLGMQVMARRGFEGGAHEGLGWIDAEVRRLTPGDASLRIPHIGWSEIQALRPSPLLTSLRPHPEVYFVHSYAMQCQDPSDVEATCEYGGPVTAAIRRGNIFATQFHPEKSQSTGLAILENFLRWEPGA